MLTWTLDVPTMLRCLYSYNLLVVALYCLISPTRTCQDLIPQKHLESHLGECSGGTGPPSYQQCDADGRVMDQGNSPVNCSNNYRRPPGASGCSCAGKVMMSWSHSGLVLVDEDGHGEIMSILKHIRSTVT